jgi:membrane associated rhomboid family serine protease
LAPAAPAPAFGVNPGESLAIRPSESAVSHDDLGGERNLADALPLLTFATIISLLVIYGVEVKAAFEFGKRGEPGVRSLVAFGAASYDLVLGADEWWRPFLAPLLHANPSHVIGNGFALAFVGMRLEPMIGRAWFAFIFAVGALGGIAGSLIGNPHALVTVGASGAISALIGALFVVSFHHRAEESDQRAMRLTALRFGIPALAPLAFAHMSSGAAQQVDYHAHLGGAILGVVAGFMLCALWTEHRPRPRFARPAAIGSFAFFAAVAVAALFAIKGFSLQAAKAAQFIPQSALPAGLKTDDRRSAELLAQYPKDPRSHIMRAVLLANARKFAPAEDELREALALSASDGGEAGVRNAAQALLALILNAEGHREAARAMAADLCRARSQREARPGLEKAGLCD